MKKISDNQQILLNQLIKFNDTLEGEEFQPMNHFIIDNCLSNGITTIGIKRCLTGLEKAGLIEYKRAKNLYDVEYKVLVEIEDPKEDPKEETKEPLELEGALEELEYYKPKEETKEATTKDFRAELLKMQIGIDSLRQRVINDVLDHGDTNEEIETFIINTINSEEVEGLRSSKECDIFFSNYFKALLMALDIHYHNYYIVNHIPFKEFNSKTISTFGYKQILKILANDLGIEID